MITDVHRMEPIKNVDDMSDLVTVLASLVHYVTTEGNNLTPRTARTIVNAGEGVFSDLTGKDAYAAGYEIGGPVSDAATYLTEALDCVKRAKGAMIEVIEQIHQVRARYSAEADALGV